MGINFNDVVFKNDLLKDYAKELLCADFRVFVYKNKIKKDYNRTKWLIIAKNNNVGNVGINYFFGLDFSTMHKPNRTTGTGFKLNNDGIIKPSIQNAINTFAFCPGWATNEDINSIKKYADIDEYLKKETILEYEEII